VNAVQGESAESAESLDDKTARLEREAAALRDKLSSLVTELDHRTHGLAPRLVKPILIAAAVAGAVVAGFWVRRRVRALLRPRAL
jgi:hypothetical protein